MGKKIRHLVKTDLSFVVIFILAALAVPRVILHDLHLIDLESFPYKIMATIPFLVWLGVALFRKTTRPFADFLTLGVVFGLLLALTHQILWTASWQAAPPQLHTELDPVVEEIILRVAAAISSVLTGIMLGAVFGLVAWVSSEIRAKLKR